MGMFGDGVVFMRHFHINNNNSAAFHVSFYFHARLEVGCTFDFAKLFQLLIPFVTS